MIIYGYDHHHGINFIHNNYDIVIYRCTKVMTDISQEASSRIKYLAPRSFMYNYMCLYTLSDKL